MKVTVYFPGGNTKETDMHYNMKENRRDVVVEIENIFYEVYFYVDGNIQYEMTADGFFSIPGMIVLNEVTTEKILKSISWLAGNGYFKYFKGYDTIPLKGTMTDVWWWSGEHLFEKENIDKVELVL